MNLIQTEIGTSPILADGKKNYLIDIDGTITDDVPNEEPDRMVSCLPFKDAVETINKWFEEGHVITFFTSRTEDHRKITEDWFAKHGINYHNLLMNKPRGGNYFIIDNHIVQAARFKGKWEQMINKKHEITVFPE